MKRDYFEEVARNPKFIPGIYNYCDRWCERCAFTSRCANFAIGQMEKTEQSACDLENAAFWKTLDAYLDYATQTVRETAAERGIDLDLTEEEAEEAEKAMARHDEKVHASLLCDNATKYGMSAKDWFDRHAAQLEDYEAILKSRLAMGLEGEPAERAARQIDDAVEVAGWYQFQIGVKLHRAVSGQLHVLEDGQDFAGDDADGSAKVALLGLDRSICAWGILRNQLGDDDDGILNLLLTLHRARAQAEKQFPKARAFQRPGFDDALAQPPPAAKRRRR